MIKLRPFIAAALVVAVVWTPPTRAATLANLYSVTVAPDPAAADQREAATQAAKVDVPKAEPAPQEPEKPKGPYAPK